MMGQLVVTSVAARGLDDIVGGHHRRAIGNEVERRAGVVGYEIELGQVSRSIAADGMGSSSVESGRRFGLEHILILPWSNHCTHTAAIGGGLHGGRQQCSR